MNFLDYRDTAHLSCVILGYDKQQGFSKAKTMAEMAEKYSKLTAPVEDNYQEVSPQSKPVRLAPLTNPPSLPSRS